MNSHTPVRQLARELPPVRVPQIVAVSPAPVWQIEILDRDAAMTLDACFPSCVRLWRAGVEPFELVVDGRSIARFHPTSSDTRIDGALNLETYEALVASPCGFDDDGETAGGRYGDDGALAVREAMPDAKASKWRGEDEVQLRESEARGRTLGMSGDAIARTTGRPFVARRSLLEACSRSRVLDASQARARAEAEQARVAAAVTVETETRPRTWKDLGAIAVCAPLNAPGAVTSEPWRFAQAVAQNDRGLYFAVRALPGLACPPGTVGVVEVLDQEEAAPEFFRNQWGAPELQDPDLYAVAFLRAARRRLMTIDDGEIARERFSRRGFERARELAERFAPEFLRPALSSRGWMQGFACELVTRGCLVQPDIATRVIAEAVVALEERRNPAVRVPAPGNRIGRKRHELDGSVTTVAPDENDFTESKLFVRGNAASAMGEAIRILCERAAGAGEVNPGELLDEPVDAPPVPAAKPKKR